MPWWAWTVLVGWAAMLVLAVALARAAASDDRAQEREAAEPAATEVEPTPVAAARRTS